MSNEAEQITWTPRLGAHLEGARVRAGLSRPALAARLGVSEETIRLWEKGAVQPAAERLARVIAVLSIEIPAWDLDSEPMPEVTPLGVRLRAERGERGHTQAHVVQLLGVAQGTYAGWETGRSTPGAAFQALVAEYLGVTAREVEALCDSPLLVDTAGWPPFGQLVGARRQALRLSRPALADALGVAARTIVSWELGYRVPSSPHLALMAEVLEVSGPELAGALPRRGPTTRLGDLILARQRELGLRSTELATLVGTTETTVSRWIHGHSRPGAKNLERLADVLRLPFSHVIDAAGPAV